MSNIRHLQEALHKAAILKKRADRRISKMSMRNIDIEEIASEEGTLNMTKRVPSKGFLANTRSYRMCISYTNSGKPCGEFVGIDHKGKLHREWAFGPYPCEYSYEKSIKATVYGLCKDNPDLYEEVMNHTFKTSGIFCYWSLSGKLTMSSLRDKLGRMWLGDFLIERALLGVEEGTACLLMTQGKTVRYIINNIDTVVKESRETFECLKAFKAHISEATKRRRWFRSVDLEALGIVSEIPRRYKHYRFNLNWDKPSDEALMNNYYKEVVTKYSREMHEYLSEQFRDYSRFAQDSREFDFSEFEDTTVFEAWREYSKACKEGTLKYLEGVKFPMEIANMPISAFTVLVYQHGTEYLRKKLLSTCPCYGSYRTIIESFLDSFAVKK